MDLFKFFSFVLFCFSKKEPKKEPRKTRLTEVIRAGITSFFREGALMELLYYCSFNVSSLKMKSN